MNIGKYAQGVDKILASNALNLPAVLNILQSNKERFERYNSYIRKIFPNVYRISVEPRENSQVEIVVWNEDPKLERQDLVIPLSESGTGIGQVLSILYVVLTADEPKIILIDEPNSFLHPGASRKLIEILKEHPQHQFIISTHSPSTISAANPKTLHIIQSNNAQATIVPINTKEIKQQQLYLAEIGSKLSDIFGADNILWVEGKTEEICFPKIVEKMKNMSQMGTAILVVKNTGDFESKHAKTIFEIYDRLSKGTGMWPSAIGFIFDREKKTKREMEDLQRQSNNNVVFTKRKMFENYLLNSSAIYNVLISIKEIEDMEITQKSVDDWIEANKWKKEFIAKSHSKDENQDNWIINVNGAKFLSELFVSLTQARVEFDKIEHSVALADWVIENSFDDMEEYQKTLSDFLKSSD